MGTGVPAGRRTWRPLAITGKLSGRQAGLLLAALLISTTSGYLGYHRYLGDTKVAPAVTTTPARIGSLTTTVSATGNVVAVREAKLGFSGSGSASGKLTELDISFGDSVKAGEVLAKLDPVPFQVAVDTAQSNLNVAKANLQELMNGSTADEVASAQAAYEAATAKYKSVAAGSTAADMITAQAAVDQAQSNLNSAQVKLDQLQKNTYTQADWAAAQAAVDSAASSLKNAQAKLAEVKQGSTQADLAAQQAAVDQAKQALVAAEDRYQMAAGGNLANSGFSSVSAAQQNYNAAKASCDAAVQKLQQMQAGPLAVDLQAAQTAVDQAQANLKSSQAKLDFMKQGPQPADLAAAQNAVDQAKAGLTSAQAKLDQLKQGPTEADLTAANSAVASAKADLDSKAGPPKATDVIKAQEQVKQAEVSLQQAQDDLKNATLVAPFDGIVAEVDGTVGEMIGNSTVVTLVDPSSVRIDATVDETDVPKIKVGQQATVTFDALPNQQFQGKVMAISPVGTASQGVVSYQVAASLDNPGGVLPDGMSANLTILTEQKDNVLVVPSRAIRTQGSAKTVGVLAGGKSETRTVQTGASNDQLTEIVSGLKAGDEVVIPSTTTKATGASMGSPGIGIPGVGGPPPQ